VDGGEEKSSISVVEKLGNEDDSWIGPQNVEQSLTDESWATVIKA